MITGNKERKFEFLSTIYNGVDVSGSGHSLQRLKVLYLTLKSLEHKDHENRCKVLGLDHTQDITHGIYEILLYKLDDFGLLDYGTTIKYPWLTKMGEHAKLLLHEVFNEWTEEEINEWDDFDDNVYWNEEKCSIFVHTYYSGFGDDLQLEYTGTNIYGNF